MIGGNVARRSMQSNSQPDSVPPIEWRGKGFSFQFPRPALVMGILNVTPDSFSDGGRFLHIEAAVEQAKQMVTEGAEIVDVGGESTRPNAEVVSVEEELARVIPVIERLAAELEVLISIDTQKPAVAEAALKAGAHIVNDIAANREDPRMWEIVAAAEAGYIAMHMLGTPQTMQQSPEYSDVISEVNEFFAGRLEKLASAGVLATQVALDVGIGFGKTLEHNLKLLAGLRVFTMEGRPQLLGASRKSLFGKLLDLDVDQRLAPGLACATWGVANGIQILRVHDVAPTVHAVRMTEAILQRTKT
jgi:dihydropteroate synthase